MLVLILSQISLMFKCASNCNSFSFSTLTREYSFPDSPGLLYWCTLIKTERKNMRILKMFPQYITTNFYIYIYTPIYVSKYAYKYTYLSWLSIYTYLIPWVHYKIFIAWNTNWYFIAKLLLLPCVLVAEQEWMLLFSQAQWSTNSVRWFLENKSIHVRVTPISNLGIGFNMVKRNDTDNSKTMIYSFISIKQFTRHRQYTYYEQHGAMYPML